MSNETQTEETKEAPGESVVITSGVPEAMVDVFRRFCDDDSIRFELSEPFVQSGRLFATNGLVAVSIPCDILDTKREGRLPDLSNTIDYTTEVTADWQPQIAECEKCDGEGSVSLTVCGECVGNGDCHCCDGAGIETCFECDRDHKCDECDGLGICSSCEGDGKVEAYRSKCDACKDITVAIASGCVLDISSARRISTLAGVRFAIVEKTPKFKLLVFESTDNIRGIACLRSD